MRKENLHRKNPKSAGLSRRAFLGTTATAAAAFTIIPRYVMGGAGYTAPSDMINVAGIGVGSQGGGDIQQICSPDVPIVRPQRNSNGTPMTKEQIAAQEARRAEMMKRNAGAGGPPGGAPIRMQRFRWELQGAVKKLPWQIFMQSVMWILIIQDILLKDIQKPRFTTTGVRCSTRRNQ